MNIKMVGDRFFTVSMKWMIKNFACSPCVIDGERICDDYNDGWVWFPYYGGAWLCSECGWSEDEK